ncbi:hypothetical protein GCM10010464_66550 [Pseudonocardia yunnanensis]|uniref:Cobalamin-independent methionine synthase MetE C-terminal/archaeal domain-containing protein n=1 Tax=Pseudonocardia yunnanensis TaxID=58107 RepID=A0ABW4FA98_9PSEU
MTAERPVGALLVGSVNLATAADVFRAAGTHLAQHLRYVPDGEPGERDNWLVFQSGVFDRHPDVELAPRPDDGYGHVLPSYRLRRGADPRGIDLRPLGYADAAESSYAEFRRLRGEGALPSHVRFQVSLPTPAAVVATFVDAGDQPALEPVYEAALLAELRRIQDVVPSGDLAVQWDVCVEMAMLEEIGGLFTPWFGPVLDGVVDRLARISAEVVSEVPLGFHLCYGDFGHQHWKEPADTSRLVEMANTIVDAVRRPIAHLHLPVPADRDDAEYFAPLRELRLRPETDLYLGLVHAGDLLGTARRAAAARTAVPRFGVATECGMGRTPRELIDGLLALHAKSADPVGGPLTVAMA